MGWYGMAMVDVMEVLPESYMEAGATLGYVSEPTKYYSKEGSNLYFAMTKDGVSVDPLEYLP